MDKKRTLKGSCKSNRDIANDFYLTICKKKSEEISEIIEQLQGLLEIHKRRERGNPITDEQALIPKAALEHLPACEIGAQLHKALECRSYGDIKEVAEYMKIFAANFNA